MRIIRPGRLGQVAVFGKAAAGGAVPTLDANVSVESGSFGSTTTNTITTTTTNQIILVLIAGQFGGTTVTGVSGASLGAFTQRAAANRFSSQRCYVYWKIASSILTGEVITVTFSATAVAGLVNTISVKNVNTGSPFDPNGSLPNLVGTGGAGGAYAAISTTNANTLAYCVNYDGTTPTVTHGAGFTLLANGFQSGMSEYQLSGGSTFSSLSMATSDVAGNNDCAIGDAVTA